MAARHPAYRGDEGGGPDVVAVEDAVAGLGKGRFA